MSGLNAIARRVAAGAGSNAAGRLAILLGRIAVTPVIVHAVGASDYGFWVLVGSLATIGGILELGVSAGLVKYVAEHSARDETDEAARIVAAANWLYRLLAVALFVMGVAASLVVPVLLGLDGHAAYLARALGSLAAVGLGVAMLGMAPLSVLKGLQRFPTVNTVDVTVVLVSVALTVVAVKLGGDIVVVSAVWTLAAGLNAMSYRVIAWRRFPEYMGGPGGRDTDRIRRLWRFSRSVAAVQVAVNMQSRLDAVVVAGALPVSQVTPYSFAQRLADGTRLATDQFGKVLLPLASQVSATLDRAAVRELYLTSTRLTLCIALGVGLPVALLGGPILEIWVGDEFAGHGALVAILTCAAIVDLPSYPAAAVLQSLERHGPIAWMALGSGVANIALSVALVGPWGLEGVATGTLVAGAVEICVFVVPYAGRTLGVSPRAFLSATVIPLLAPSVALAALLLAGHAVIGVDSLLTLLLVVAPSVTVYALLYARVGASQRELGVYRAAASAAFRRPGRVR